MGNVASWEVSYIDDEGIYHGDTHGVSTGTTSIYTADGAISLNDTFAYVSNTNVGAITLTVPAGSSGQMLTIKALATPNGNIVIEPADFADGTSITFDADNEVALIQHTGNEWCLISTTGTLA